MKISENLYLGGPHADSYSILVGRVRSQRIREGLFEWVAQQMGRLANTISISDYTETRARSLIAEREGSSFKVGTVFDEVNDLNTLIGYKIPGIGPKRAKILLDTFGSLQRLEQASFEDIMKTPGFKEALSMEVVNYFQESR